jgi:uncharacterized membrane protein
MITFLLFILFVCFAAVSIALFNRLCAAEDKIEMILAKLNTASAAAPQSVCSNNPQPNKAEEKPKEASFEELLQKQKERVMPAKQEYAPVSQAVQQPMPAQSVEAAPAPAKEPISAAKIFSAVGGFTLLLGVIFAFKYYQDSIPASARFGASLLFGAALLGAGLKKNLESAKATAATLCGAGLAVIYASFYAAYAFYHIIPASLAFIFMAATAALSFPVSIKKDSPYIASLSVLIAFFTPMLLSSGKDMYGFLFAYIAFVNAAAFAVGLYKKWPVVIRLALIFTFITQLIAALKGAAVDSCAMFVFYVGATAWVAAKFGQQVGVPKKTLSWFIYSNILLTFCYIGRPVGIENIIKVFSFVFFGQMLSGFLMRRDYSSYKTVFNITSATVFVLLLQYFNAGVFADMFYLNAVFLCVFSAITLWGDFAQPAVPEQSAKPAGLGFMLPLAFIFILVTDFYVTSSMAHFIPLAFLLALPLVFGIGRLFPLRQDLRGILFSAVIICGVWAVLFDASFNTSFAYNSVAFLQALLIVYGVVYLAKFLRGELSFEDINITKFSFVLLPYLLLTVWFYMHVKAELYAANGVFIVLALLVALNAAFAFWYKNGRPLIFTVLGVLFAGAAFYALHLSQGKLTEAEILSGSLRVYGGQALALLFIQWICGIFSAILLLPLIFKKRFIDNKEVWAAAGFGGIAAFLLVYITVKENFNIYNLAAIPLAFAFVYAAAEAFVYRWQAQEEGIQAFRLSVLGGALLFFITAVIAVAFQREWLTITLAAQGVLLLWINLRLKQDWLKYAAAGLFITVFARLITNPAIFAYYPSGAKILNWYLYTYLFAAATMFAGAKLYKAEGSLVPAMLNGFGAILLFALVNIEIADFYTLSGPLHFDIFGGFAQTVTYTLAWALFGVGCLWSGILKRSKLVTLAGLSLITLATVKVFCFDLWSLGALYRLFGLFGMAAILIFAGLMLEKFKTALKGFDN